MSDRLPPTIATLVSTWPEFRMAVHRIQVVLSDGRVIDNVMVSGGSIRGVLGGDGVSFDASEVISATDFASAPLPPGY